MMGLAAETDVRLILASGSPRRRELLAGLGCVFQVIPAQLAEPAPDASRSSPRAWCMALAYYKAQAVAILHPGALVLGADTLVACGAEILGKPRDVDDARRMLELQAQTPSLVLTGVALVRVGAPQQTAADGSLPAPMRSVAAAATRVWMRDDRAEREAYLAGDDWRDKAGAYGIQTVGDRLVERVSGSFSNVMGLPLELVEQMLGQQR